MANDPKEAGSESTKEPLSRAAGGHLGTPEFAATDQPESPASIVTEPSRNETLWGYQLIWAETEDYAARTLHIRAGEALTLRLHEERDKTLFLVRGEIELEVGPGVNSLRSVEVRVGEAFRIRPGVLHRILATTDAEIVEAGTAELDDVLHLEARSRDEVHRGEGTE